MKERPILMSAPMVRSTLDDSKTHTRRTQALEYFSTNDPDNWRCVRISGDTAYFVYKNSPIEREVKCPYGQIGDRLWVREAWRAPSGILDDIKPSGLSQGTPIRYEADLMHSHGTFNPGKLHPSMFMPRWASRITLEINGVRVERLQDISEDDAMAEGLDPDCGDGCCWRNPADKTLNTYFSPVDAYRALWEQINGAGSWDSNPWVFVIEFRRIKP